MGPRAPGRRPATKLCATIPPALLEIFEFPLTVIMLIMYIMFAYSGIRKQLYTVSLDTLCP